MGAPMSRMKQPRSIAPQYEPKDAIARQDAEEAAEKRPAIAPTGDKVAQLLSDPVYVTDYTWPSLYVEGPGGRMRQLFVTQFFPNKNVAVDKFYSMDEVEPWTVDIKRAALDKIGIRYVALYPTTKLADVAAGLGV